MNDSNLRVMTPSIAQLLPKHFVFRSVILGCKLSEFRAQVNSITSKYKLDILRVLTLNQYINLSYR